MITVAVKHVGELVFADAARAVVERETCTLALRLRNPRSKLRNRHVRQGP